MITVDRASGLELYRQMQRVRRFEERCVELYSEARIRGFLHLYIGEEAVAVGVMGHLRPDDAVLATYREHGHALVRGVPMNAVMAEMFGKAEGCSHGRGGSMHLFDAPTRFYGGKAIVAAGLPQAVGLALADQMLGRDSITVCFFGEGAVAEGEFHEAMNLAALWQLPVCFCARTTFMRWGRRWSARSRRPTSGEGGVLRDARWSVDGMDVLAVSMQPRRAVEAVRTTAAAPSFWRRAPTGSELTRCTTRTATATSRRSSSGSIATRSAAGRPAAC